MVPVPQAGDIWVWDHGVGFESYVLLLYVDDGVDYLRFYAMNLESGECRYWSFRPHLMHSWEYLA